MSEPDYYNKNGLSPLKAFEEGLLSEEEYIGFLKEILLNTLSVQVKKQKIPH